MIRAAALASGDGVKLQAILDSMYFKEIPNFELVAVICPQKDAYAMKRSLSAKVPAYVVDPELFPTMTSHSMAVANKLRDMDIELVILAGYDLPLGVNNIGGDLGADGALHGISVLLRADHRNQLKIRYFLKIHGVQYGLELHSIPGRQCCGSDHLVSPFLPAQAQALC